LLNKINVLLLVFVLAFTGCGKNAEPPVFPPPVAEPDNPELPAPKPTEICRFTGREIPAGTALERPILVIYDNTKPARPPAGLKEAGIVYEVPVEGGSTRLLALFTHSFDEAIGPIRSARPYFVTLTLEHGGILAHCGFSPQAQSLLRTLSVAHINEIVQEQYYFRDNSRRTPYNLYTRTELLIQGAQRLKYLPATRKVSPVFRTGKAVLGPGEAAGRVTLNYSSAAWSEYVFDEVSERYLRYVEGDKHTDIAGDQIAVKTLIVQFVNIVAEEPGSERLAISLVGQGSGYYFVNGRGWPLSWHKEAAAAPTRFLLDGQELVLSPGTTWIHYVHARSKKSVTFN